MSDPLQGIKQKLDRAYECISNLDGEITAFFLESNYPGIPHEDSELFDVALNYHLRREIPIRFKVLAGEIVHHLRSCLDHLVWQLSSLPADSRARGRLEFPIFDREPIRKEEISGYERKIEGLSEVAKGFVLSFQPYIGPRPRENPLFLIHELDRIDKHRELVVIFPGFSRKLGKSALDALMEYGQKKSDISLKNFELALKADSQVTPQLAFGEIGEWKDKAVVPSLSQLLGVVQMVIDEAEIFFR